MQTGSLGRIISRGVNIVSNKIQSTQTSTQSRIDSFGSNSVKEKIRIFCAIVSSSEEQNYAKQHDVIHLFSFLKLFTTNGINNDKFYSHIANRINVNGVLRSLKRIDNNFTIDNAQFILDIFKEKKINIIINILSNIAGSQVIGCLEVDIVEEEIIPWDKQLKGLSNMVPHKGFINKIPSKYHQVFVDCINGDFSGLNLSYTCWRFVDFSGSDFTRSQFIYSNFENCNFGKSVFGNCNFKNSSIVKCSFIGCYLQQCNLGACNLTGSDFSYAEINLMGLIGADLTLVNLKHISLTLSKLSYYGGENFGSIKIYPSFSLMCSTINTIASISRRRLCLGIILRYLSNERDVYTKDKIYKLEDFYKIVSHPAFSNSKIQEESLPLMIRKFCSLIMEQDLYKLNHKNEKFLWMVDLNNSLGHFKKHYSDKKMQALFINCKDALLAILQNSTIQNNIKRYSNIVDFLTINIYYKAWLFYLCSKESVSVLIPDIVWLIINTFVNLESAGTYLKLNTNNDSTALNLSKI